MPLLATTNADAPARRPLPVFSGLVLLVGGVALLARLRAALPLEAYDDDAFYYFQIARHLARGHGSTFDGIHLTNGYHPLWLLLCTAFAWISESLSSGRLFFILLQLTAFASFAVTFFATRALLRRSGAQKVLVEISAAAVAMECVLLIHGGMEITLTLPLALVLGVFRLRESFRWSLAQSSAYGLLAALVVLSRLDALLWVALLLAAELLLALRENTHARLMRFVAIFVAIVAGAVPLAIYGLVNHRVFGLWMPVSAAAKELRPHHTFTLTGLRDSLYLLDQAYGMLLVYPALPLMLAAVAALLLGRARFPQREDRALALTWLAFPVVQLAALCFTSDWQVWSWYLYTFLLATVGALMTLLAASPKAAAHAAAETSPQPGRNAFQLIPLIACSLVLTLGMAYCATAAAGKEIPHWSVFAHEIEAFSQTHPGGYAMGDCSGMAGYLLHDPLLQTEGLVMDKDFLENIRQQRDLHDVLAQYGVRYYVTFRAIPVNGCYRVAEPAMAGPASPRMHATLCQQPVATFPYGRTGIKLMIFDLAPGTSAR